MLDMLNGIHLTSQLYSLQIISYTIKMYACICISTYFCYIYEVFKIILDQGQPSPACLNSSQALWIHPMVPG